MEVGISYEPGLARFIPSAARRGLVSMVEVIPDAYLYDRSEELGTLLSSLALPYAFHYIGQSWGSADYANHPDLKKLVEQVGTFAPLYLSDHLTCCRSGGIDLRQNISMPRRRETADVVISNIRRCRAAVKRDIPLLLENVALNDAGAADELSPLDFYRDIVSRAGAGCLLDVHNLVADEENFGLDPEAFILGLPPELILEVHIAGGTWSSRRTAYFDSHLSKIPARAFELLALTLRHARPRWIVFERLVGANPTGKRLRELEQDLESIHEIVRRHGRPSTHLMARRRRSRPVEDEVTSRKRIIAEQQRDLERIVATSQTSSSDIASVMRAAARGKYLEILSDALQAFFPVFMRTRRPTAEELIARFRGRGLNLDLRANIDQLHRVLSRWAKAEMGQGFVDLLALERALSRCRRGVRGKQLVRVVTDVVSAYPRTDPRKVRRLPRGPRVVVVSRRSDRTLELSWSA